MGGQGDSRDSGTRGVGGLSFEEVGHNLGGNFETRQVGVLGLRREEGIEWICEFRLWLKEKVSRAKQV